MRNARASLRAASLRLALGLGLVATTAGCPPGVSSSKVESAVDQSMSEGQPGYQLAMQAVGCWSGWLWAEAEGYLPAERRAVTEVRCRQVLRRAFGDGQDRYQRMRDMDPALVKELAQKAGELSAGEERELVPRLLLVAADAQREAMEAWRAAVKVRRDLNDPKELTHLDPEEIELLRELHDSAALEALRKVELGPLTDDARVLGLLVALGRVETIRRLPLHLRPHAVEHIAKILFGAELPPLTEDETKPLPSAVAVTYLADVARVAGYPVPDTVQHTMGRSLLAFSGIAKALSDRIRDSESKLSKDADPTLRRIAQAVVKRLDQEHAEAQQAAQHQQQGVPGGARQR